MSDLKVCAECGKETYHVTRSLCRCCYRNPAIRARYPVKKRDNTHFANIELKTISSWGHFLVPATERTKAPMDPRYLTSQQDRCVHGRRDGECVECEQKQRAGLALVVEEEDEDA